MAALSTLTLLVEHYGGHLTYKYITPAIPNGFIGDLWGTTG